MRVVTQFPERFKLVNEQVAELVLWYPLSENEAETPRKVVSDGVTYEYGGYYDFYVTMKDGRCLGFSAFTPEQLRESMDEAHNLSFVTSGLIVVSEIGVEAFLEALESGLRWTTDYPLEHFGFPCRTSPEKTSKLEPADRSRNH